MPDEQHPVPVEPGQLKTEISASLAAHDENPPLARIPWLVQTIWVLVAAFGFLDNVFGSGASFRHPGASTTALAWLVLVLVGLTVNHLDKIGLPGGGNLSFRKLERTERAAAKREVSVEALRRVLSDYSDLMQNWAQSINLFAEQLEEYAKKESDVEDILARFCLGRMEEARDVIAERGDRTRLSFWLYVELVGGLKMCFSDDIRDPATLNHVFKPGAGLLGQCYVESRIYNLDDAPSSIYYEEIRPNPDYHGLLLIPVKARTKENAIGVLAIDREKAEEFGSDAENVASALADLIAYAMETALDLDVEETRSPS